MEIWDWLHGGLGTGYMEVWGLATWRSGDWLHGGLGTGYMKVWRLAIWRSGY